MNELGFATDNTFSGMSFWLWLLGCIALLLCWLWLQHRLKHNGALQSATAAYQIRHLSRQARLHVLEIDGCKFHIFESGQALIQLHPTKAEQKDD